MAAPAPPNYRSLAASDAAKYGVDPNIFIRQIQQESGFNPDARSGAGAVGIAQFMPGTARGYGIDPTNPVQSLDAAARYDASELKAFGGDYHKALAAYNAGAGNADKWNDPSFAGGQTYNYVRDILNGGKPAAFTPDATPQPVAPRQPVTPGAQSSPIQAALRLLGFTAPPQARQPVAPSLLTAPRTPIQATSTTTPFSAAGGKIVGDTAGEQSGFLQRLAALSTYEHAPVDINSGYRSAADQARLYANRASNPNPVAPPGRSLHQQGLAADGTVGGVPLGRLPAALLARFGLALVPGDPVHVQALR